MLNMKYLEEWLSENTERIIESEWYDDLGYTERMHESIVHGVLKPEIFIEGYIIPTIESNISWDMGCASIDAAKLLGFTEVSNES